MAFWIATGANVLEVSRRAGHSSVSFTVDRYGHLFPAVSERLAAIYVEPRRDPVAGVVQLTGRSVAS
jgi:hypothetical protein